LLSRRLSILVLALATFSSTTSSCVEEDAPPLFERLSLFGASLYSIAIVTFDVNIKLVENTSPSTLPKEAFGTFLGGIVESEPNYIAPLVPFETFVVCIIVFFNTFLILLVSLGSTYGANKFVISFSPP